MALFLNLYLGHLLGDFVLQPGRLVLAKRKGLPGLALHVLLLGACTAAVLFASIRSDWPAVLLVAASHALIEELTIATYLKTPTRGVFTLLFDQTMHLLAIALVVWLAHRWRIDSVAITFGLRAPIWAVASLAGLLTATLFGSILIYESVNAVPALGDSKGNVLRFDLSRVAGITERGAAFVLALAWHPLAMVLPFVPRLVYATRLPSDRRYPQLVHAAVGLLLCAIVYSIVWGIIVVTGSSAPHLWGRAVWAVAPVLVNHV